MAAVVCSCDAPPSVIMFERDEDSKELSTLEQFMTLTRHGGVGLVGLAGEQVIFDMFIFALFESKVKKNPIGRLTEQRRLIRVYGEMIVCDEILWVGLHFGMKSVGVVF